MSDEDVSVEAVEPDIQPETETLIPLSRDVTVVFEDADGTEHTETYNVKDFKAAKTLLMLEVVSELLDGGDVASLFVAGDGTAVIRELATKLPSIVHTARPVLTRGAALVLTPDGAVAALEASGDVRKALSEKGTALMAALTVPQLFDVIVLGIKAMGIETIRTGLPKLMQALRG